MAKHVFITVSHAGCPEAYEPRECDRRALEAARAFDTALSPSFQVHFFANTTILRENCDLNRARCGDNRHYYFGTIPEMHLQVAEAVRRVGPRDIAFLLDVHSFPDSASFGGTDANVVFLEAPSPWSARIKGSLTSYDWTTASAVNHFLTYMRAMRVPALLVEIREDTRVYPRDALLQDVDRIARVLSETEK